MATIAVRSSMVVWQDPPHPAYTHDQRRVFNETVIAQLRERPGMWALIRAWAYQKARTDIKPPPGDIETLMVRVEGGSQLYARCIPKGVSKADMARTESRTKTAIWSDDDFRQLTGRAQRMYWMLYSQSTINLCGVLALTLQRWARSAAGETVETVDAGLLELSEHGYILVDRGTEEVWVRTFSRHDGVGRSPATLPAAWRQLSTVASLRLRRAAAAALFELGAPPADWQPPVGVENLADLPKHADPSLFDTLLPTHPDTHPDTLVNGSVNTHPDTQEGTLRGRARAVSSLRLQSPVSSLPSPAPPSPPAAAKTETGRTASKTETKPKTGSDAELRLVHAVADVCHGTNRAVVRSEASALVLWATAKLDPLVVEEAVGWASQQARAPDLPRALASVIRAKAADRGIRLGQFAPPNGRR